MPMPRLIMVGGFLGAGKTTLLAAAAARLAGQGKRVGLVTNDQAAGLVDSALLKDGGSVVEEVPDGCFCCRFQDLVAAVERLEAVQSADVILTEPVGSCTDLSATVLQPVKKLYAERFRLAPLSVLVDPGRLREAFEKPNPAGFPAQVLYIFRKQLEEADLLVLNKTDALAGAELESLRALLRERFPGVPTFAISAAHGDGVDGWLEFVLEHQPAGTRITAVDYDEYAAGEAALGWLNASLRLRAGGDVDWGLFCWKLIDAMHRELQARAAEVAHLKIRLAAVGGAITASLTANRARPLLVGKIVGDPRGAALLINARAHLDPQQLRSIVESCLRTLAAEQVEIVVEQMRSFSPSRPQPTHRFGCVVPA
jgi:Ni2+-binding GTPase involved in maturation of urease and hydrogenase